MPNQQQVANLHRRDPNLTAAQLAARLDTRPEYIRSVAKRLGLVLPGALVPHAKLDAAIIALEQVRDGLANVSTTPGLWTTRDTSQELFRATETAIKAARAAR